MLRWELISNEGFRSAKEKLRAEGLKPTVFLSWKNQLIVDFELSIEIRKRAPQSTIRNPQCF